MTMVSSGRSKVIEMKIVPGPVRRTKGVMKARQVLSGFIA
jgi:hypothetical protein